jgi:hypothetical protein
VGLAGIKGIFRGIEGGGSDQGATRLSRLWTSELVKRLHQESEDEYAICMMHCM